MKAGGGLIDKFAIVRYNSNGSLDTTFDFDGIVTIETGNFGSFGRAIAIQNDGKIVVTGFSAINNGYEVSLARYNINGSIDSTFDTDGLVSTQFGNNNCKGYSLALQNDGKIVVAGYGDVDFALIRYNTDGSLDTSFDNDGIVSTPIGPFGAIGESVSIQSDGKIIVAGYTLTYPDFALAR